MHTYIYFGKNFLWSKSYDYIYFKVPCVTTEKDLTLFTYIGRRFIKSASDFLIHRLFYNLY